MTGTAASAEAGVDLEMPGPGRAFGPALAAAVRAGEVDEKLVDAQVTRLLSVFERVGALDDGGPGEETAVDDPAHRAVARRAATEAMVLLANDGLLPLDRDDAAHRGGHRAQRRPHRDHGRRIGLAPGALPRHPAGGARPRRSATA